MNSSEIKPGHKRLTLQAWLWVGACVMLIVVITVPVCQFMNTLNAVNHHKENPSKTIPAGGLLALLVEKPDDIPLNPSPLNVVPPVPASPGTPVNPKPALVTPTSSKDGKVPAKAASTDAGSESSTVVVTYTDYVNYYFNPPVIDKTEVNGNEPFSIWVNANVTLVKDIPFIINSANLTLTVYATDTNGSKKIPLIITGNNVIFTMPGSLNESSPFSQQVTLCFPQNTLDRRYHITMTIIGLVIGTMFGDYSIGFGQPDQVYDLGYINYHQSTP